MNLHGVGLFLADPENHVRLACQESRKRELVGREKATSRPCPSGRSPRQSGDFVRPTYAMTAVSMAMTGRIVPRARLSRWRKIKRLEIGNRKQTVKTEYRLCSLHVGNGVVFLDIVNPEKHPSPGTDQPVPCSPLSK